MYRLSQHTDLQSILRQELKDFGISAGENYSISESQYERMMMLNALLNEMMRLEPPLPITLRKTVRDTTISNHAVKAGTYIVISPYAMGRSNTIWGPSASTFDPYRWIDFRGPSEQTTQLSADEGHGNVLAKGNCQNNERYRGLQHHPYGMLTFLKGPKGCTGEQFARAEMRRVIAALVAEFVWTPAQIHEPEQNGIVVVSLMLSF